MTEIDAVRKVARLSRADRVSKLFGREEYDPFDYQRDLLNHAEDETVAKAAVKPGRQTGKTETGGAIAADAAICGRDVLILAPFQDTVDDMMDSCRNHIETARERAPDAIGVEKVKKREIEFVHSGRIRARTVGTAGTQIRGKHPEVCLVDEAAYIADRIYTQVIEPFFSTHDRYEFYLFSTPAGQNGYFYRRVVDSDDWYSPHWPTEISPLVSDDWLAQKREETDRLTFLQEYEGEFVSEGDAYLPLELVKPCVGDTSDTNLVSLGVDIARKGSDRTVYIGMDNEQNAVVLDSEEQSTVPGVVGRIGHLHEQYDFDSIAVDENAVGGGVADFGQENLGGVVQPVTFSTQSKHEMYTNLKQAFEAETVTIPDHRRLIDELTSLTYSFTSNNYVKVSHRDGEHDDFADALALALHAPKVGGQVRERKSRTRMLKE